MRKVALIGAGAMGCVLGAHLAKGGADVTLVDPYKEHMDKIAKDGLILNSADNRETVKMKTAYTADDIGVMDYVVLLTKTTYSDAGLQGAKNAIGENTYIGTFQNGLGNPEKIAEYYPKERIFYGCLNLTSRIIAPGEILGNCFADPAIYTGSVVRGEEQRKVGEAFAEALTKGGASCKYTDEIDTYVWQKALLNIMGNATSGIVRLRGGDILSADEYQRLSFMIVEEVCTVAKAKGVQNVTVEKFFEALPAMTAGLSHHWASMAQDILFAKRQTEIKTLNGAIVTFGRELGIPTPVNETLYCIVRVIEEHYDQQYQESKDEK